MPVSEVSACENARGRGAGAIVGQERAIDHVGGGGGGGGGGAAPQLKP